MSTDWDAVQQAMQRWVVSGSALPSEKVVWAQQDAPRPAGPAIILRVSNIAETGQPWVDHEDNPLVFADLTVTAVDTSTNTFATTAHGLLTGDGPVNIASTGALPTAAGGGLAPATAYWIIAPDANHVQLARTYADTGGGQGAGNPTTPIDITSTGSGTIKISSIAATLRAGQEILAIARTLLRATLELHCHSAVGVGVNMATSILQRVRGRRKLPSQLGLMAAANIAVITADRVRAILGTRDALLFEPRGYLDVHFCVPCEESEAQTVIARVQATNLLTGRVLNVP